MKLIWITDTHFRLEATSRWRALTSYIEEIAAQEPDAVLLGGDLCDGGDIRSILSCFRKGLKVPIYCVLGNHEYMGAAVDSLRAQMVRYTGGEPGISWLQGDQEPVWLEPGVALIGADTWGDARAGNLSAHNLRRRGHQFMYDQISDVRTFWEEHAPDSAKIARELQAFLRAKGDEAAEHLYQVGKKAAEKASQVLVLMHAPPFQEATLHLGETSENGLPFFCAVAAGEAVTRLCTEFPDTNFTVLAGHTHSGVDLQITKNLGVLVHDPGGRGRCADWGVISCRDDGVTYRTDWEPGNVPPEP